MKKHICVFCGSRDGDNLDTIAKASDLGRDLANAGYGIVFGGGRLGLMGAVARSAIGVGGSVIGIIPTGLTAREPVQQELSELFVVDDIIERKRLMMEKSDAFVVLPGGFGTLDELMEVLTLVQTGKSRKIPIILVGTKFWSGMIAWFRETLISEGLISPDDMDLIQLTDEPEEVVAAIFKYYETRGFELSATDLKKQLYL